MQTFLPYASFQESARCLDYRRLGKQRVEAFQLLNALGNKWSLEERGRRIIAGSIKDKPIHGWRNHPACVMWRGYEEALGEYLNACILEWIRRGYNNTLPMMPVNGLCQMPSWFGMHEIHSSHRANLLRKDFTFYSKYGWTEDPSMPYFWPNNLDLEAKKVIL